jgi:hypothetical protein
MYKKEISEFKKTITTSVMEGCHQFLNGNEKEYPLEMTQVLELTSAPCWIRRETISNAFDWQAAWRGNSPRWGGRCNMIFSASELTSFTKLISALSPNKIVTISIDPFAQA